MTYDQLNVLTSPLKVEWLSVSAGGVPVCRDLEAAWVGRRCTRLSVLSGCLGRPAVRPSVGIEWLSGSAGGVLVCRD